MKALTPPAFFEHGTLLQCQEEFREQLVQMGIDNSSDWCALVPGEVVSESERVKTFKVKLNDKRSVFYKYYRYSDRPIEFFLRKSKCHTEVAAYTQLKRLNIPCAEVLAWGEKRLLGTLRQNFIITAAIEDTITLERYMDTLRPEIPEDTFNAAFKSIFTQLVDILKKMHGGHFYHYDLKWRNILVQHPRTSEPKLFIIDSPRGRIKRWNIQRGQLVDLSALARLATLHMKPSQRLRFLHRYLDGAGKTCPKALYRKVQKHLFRRPPRHLR